MGVWGYADKIKVVSWRIADKVKAIDWLQTAKRFKDGR